MVLTHVPLHPGATGEQALLWNYDEVLSLLQCSGPGVVAMVLAGHYHPGGYAMDEYATHHVTLPSPLNQKEDDPRCHCTIEIWHDRIEILGTGLVPKRTLSIDQMHHSKCSC